MESRREALLYTDVTCFGSEWQQLILFLPPTHDEDESFTEPSHPLYPEPFNPFLRNKGLRWRCVGFSSLNMYQSNRRNFQ